MTQSPNIERIVAILSAFDHENRPLQPKDILNRCGVARSTGFALLAALTNKGYLERAESGYRLGSASRDLPFAPIDRVEDRATLRAGPLTTYSAPEGLKMHPQLFNLVSWSPVGSSPPWKIGFANASRSNPWRVALERSVTEKHARLLPWVSDIIVRNAEDNAERQADQIEELVALGIDALVVSASPQTSRKLTSSLRRCMKRGLPVVALDRRPVCDDCHTVFVTASDDLIGGLSAIWLSEHLKGEGNLWLLSGLRGASPTERRLKAALSVFEKLPNVTITAQRYTTWTREGGRSTVEDLLSRTDHIPDGVWSDSGLQGLGSIDAFLGADVPIPPHTGGDVNGIYRAALESRLPLCAIDYPSSMGAKAIDAAITLLRGESTTRRVEVPTPVILTRGNETKNVKADIWAEDHVRWDLADDALLS